MTRSGPTARPPRRAVWEITQRCHLRCAHCLVEGGAADPAELTPAEALEVVEQLASLGVRVVTLTGGEPLLRPEWLALAERLRARGLGLRISGTGHGLDGAVLTRLEALGTESFAVSVDGLRQTHDALRRWSSGGGPSPFDEALAALALLRRSVIRSSVITTVTAQALDELEPLHGLLVDQGVRQWMIQLAHRTGRLRHHAPKDGEGDAAPIAPGDLPRLAAFLVKAGRHPQLRPLTHNTVGYLSATEPLLRRPGRARRLGFWPGCECGVTTVGIAPNGDVKGCANQVGAPFVVGNLRAAPLAKLWQDRRRWHWLAPSPERAAGACAGCALFPTCQGGCTALAYAATGSLFDNPYCLRALEAGGGQGRP